MNTTTIISLIAASLTVISFMYLIYRYFAQNTKTISSKVDQIELALETKQRFLIKEGSRVILLDSDKIIELDHDEIMVVDYIENEFVFGKIFHSSVKIKVHFFYIGDEQ